MNAYPLVSLPKHDPDWLDDFKETLFGTVTEPTERNWRTFAKERGYDYLSQEGDGLKTWWVVLEEGNYLIDPIMRDLFWGIVRARSAKGAVRLARKAYAEGVKNSNLHIIARLYD